MEIRYEEGSELEIEILEVTDEQFYELVTTANITPEGYWVRSKETWNVLAIGLDQIPGGYELEISCEVEVH
jgi:hypothetical protein